MMSAIDSRCHPIAIVGSGCRFPGYTNSPSRLWDLLSNPHQLAEPIPLDRFSAQGYYHESGQYHGHFNVKEAYFLAGEGVHRRFDASFFGMNPAEANCLDPQCRLLLETVYEALEAAGLTIEVLRGSDTAVYTGQMVGDYDQIMMRDVDGIGTYHASGTSHAILSNRISYFFDWHGPSMTIDTACSSSLVAVHQAIQQLRTEHSRVAIAAGANLLMDPGCFIALSSLNMLSPEGRSRMWDADANGYARGEGIAAVVLKTLSAALEDGDSIECIIRETGFAQDGKTQGITSPNHSAQTQLIRDCYSRAGLDLSNPADRPQYFECHGTGTLAGDAAEAEAISSAFFPNASKVTNTGGQSQPLVVGSIKSIIGHTEGTAGLAGILKASLALQNATLTPNLLFSRLNPKIEPFYQDLKLSNTSTPWPHVVHGSPRRASVNSFGFGGANVHAILESYEPKDMAVARRTSSAVTAFLPFVFSAYSKSSLIGNLERVYEYLKGSSELLNLRDLAYTLSSRRTDFQFAAAVAAASVEDLSRKIANIKDVEKNAGESGNSQIFRRSHTQVDRPRFLGIFTGQGAQFAGMGAALLQSSKIAYQIFQRLETRLSCLPVADRPQWSLLEEIARAQSSTRIGKANISQPLCTAVQILQVDLLLAAGIKFDAVVGHSSGEIAAAYAAGFLTAEDAICIAYYRGLHSDGATGPNGEPGAMMAVGTSADDMQQLCDDPMFRGRLYLAALNSPASVTVSGDRDALAELEVILLDEKKFVRRLDVDKAYHSHHMLPCSKPYLESMASLKMQVHDGTQSAWFSSVLSGEEMSGKQELLKGTYWDNNMISPVLFEKAITRAFTSLGQISCALEVGPHPTLKGPTIQTMQAIRNIPVGGIPYTGLFRRNTPAVESVAEALGYVYTRVGKNAVNLQKYDQFVSDHSPCRLVKGLPTYAWDHDEYWHESRYAKAIRLRQGPVHELLGHLTPDSNDQDMRWRHVLKPIEIPWLLGHRLQNQVVFPAAGYVVTAIETALAVCEKKRVLVSRVELIHVEFGRALVFEADDSKVEVLISLADIVHLGADIVEANFRYHAADATVDKTLNLMATARLQISLGEACDDVLPVRAPKPPNLLKVRPEDFYTASKDLEYHWAGPFAALDNLERKFGAAIGTINVTEPSRMLLHPATLDAAFQGVLLAYSYPDDGQLWTIHVPWKIERLIINPYLCAREKGRTLALPFASSHHPDCLKMIGNVDIFPSDSYAENAILQVEGLESYPLSRASALDDKEAFATVIWDVASPDLHLAIANNFVTKEESDLAPQLERMAGFYLRELVSRAPSDRSPLAAESSALVDLANDVLFPSQAYQASLWCPEWENDTYEQMISACQGCSLTIEMQLCRLIHDSLAPTIETNRQPLQLQTTLAEQFYSDALGLRISYRVLAQIVKQLTHRLPHMDILHLGAGAATAAKAILEEIGSAFLSYTFSGTSFAMADAKQKWIVPHLHKVAFKTLNLRQDPVTQNFVEQSYDLIVVSPNLHTSSALEEVLQNIRRLMKPGGKLLILDLYSTKTVVYPFILGAIPELSQGANGVRSMSPSMSPSEWDDILKHSGFSGCDMSTGTVPSEVCSIMSDIVMSQATDERINFLRRPFDLSSADLFKPGTLIKELVIVGGAAQITAQTKQLVQHNCVNIRTISTMLDLHQLEISPKTTVLSLTELQDPLFQHVEYEQWEALKEMIMTVGVVLWITQGRRARNPYSNMMAGLMRSVIREVPTLCYQILDFEDSDNINAHHIAEALLRLQAEDRWQRQDGLSTFIENEMVLDSDGRLTIPRLIINKEMNDRYNSTRRPIKGRFDVHSQDTSIALMENQPGYELIQGSQSYFGNGTNKARLETTTSSFSAIRVAEVGCMFLQLGKHESSEKHILALSPRNSSIMNSSDHPSIGVDLTTISKNLFLSVVAHHLLASVLLRGLTQSDRILVYEPDPAFARVLANIARLIGVLAKFITSSSLRRGYEDLDWLKIHPSTPGHTISCLIPKDITVFVNLGIGKQNESIGNRIQSLLPTHCRTDSTRDLLTEEARTPIPSQFTEIQDRLHIAVARATLSIEAATDKGDLMLPVIRPSSLAEGQKKLPPLSLIDWTGCPDVSVKLSPMDTQTCFSGQRTYWFAGLSGGLGQALCEWMARHGANYFMISSRNPKIHGSWSQMMQELGIVVRIASCDVTIGDQVIALHREICATMPPIGGVVQGSMVLDDTAFSAMTVENLLKGTKPKVEGSVHLDNLFQQNTLDFFVFLSSIVSVIGRPGQSNYSAANAFMTSLAEQRRRKGLAASIMHIGPIYGIGYAAQQDKPFYSRSAFRSMAMIPTSERDFYQLFAEAVCAGRAGPSGDTIELFSGARRIRKHESDRPVWETDPLMSHFVRNFDGFAHVVTGGQDRIPLRTQLAQAQDRGQVYNIVRDGFLLKIYTLFQVDPNKVSKESLIEMRLDDMGIDSLLAVEIRGWFMKTLEANVPVLKILSGAPVGDLIAVATERIPSRLVPNLEPDQAPNPVAESQEVTTPLLTSKSAELDSDSTSSQTTSSGPSAVGLSSSRTSDEPIGQRPSYSKMFRLSFSQEMFWFVWAFLDDKTSLNHTAWARITGRVRVSDLRIAIGTLAQQHEILRTCIVEQDGKPVQAIMDTSPLYLEVVQIEAEEDVHRMVSLLQNDHVYDLVRGQTIRCMLLSISPELHYFVAGLHPVIADGMSFLSLLKGIQQLYTSPKTKDQYKLHQFSHYSDRQHADIAMGRFTTELDFWKAELAVYPQPLPILTLSTKTSRPALRVYDNNCAAFEVRAELKGKIQAICRRHRVTPFHFYVAAFRALLLRFSPPGDGEDIAIGIGDGNRTESGMMDVIGPFVNLLALRLRTQLSSKFTELLQTVRAKAYAALAHSKLPFQVLLNELNISRSISHTPLFQSFVNYRQGLLQTTQWQKGDDSFVLHSVEIGISKMAYDVTLEILDYTDGGCIQKLVVRKDLYGPAEVRKLAQIYERLIEAFVTDPDLSLDGPDLCTPAEMQEVLRFSRGPSWPNQWPETLIHKVDQIANSQLQDVAVRYGKFTATYRDILTHSSAITIALQAANIDIGSPVAVLLEPNIAWISCLLGTMRAGAVYLPLDLSLPWARLEAMVHDCQPNFILVDKNTRQHVSKLKRPAIQVIDISNVERQVVSTAISARADGPAAILYTSGSSGAPKGIILKHEGLRNWTEHIARSVGLGKESVLQQTSPIFDLSLIQIFTALCYGGSLCVVARQQRGDAESISQIIANERITFTCATPSEYTSWLHYGKRNLKESTAWKSAFCAGEPVPLSLVESLASLGMTDLTVYNLYGPSEASLTCTATEVPLDTSCRVISAGRPLPNYSVYIVDNQLRPVPIGMQGEIYIGGPGVGLGYLNRPELTLEKFVPNVFDQPKDGDSHCQTMHRTGDLGRWLEDGRLLVEGRIDTQIKLRGLRIDLAEVEDALLDVADGELYEAVVSVRRFSIHEPEFLMAHVVFARATDRHQHLDVIRSKLSKRLPLYMCPAAFQTLDQMPTTISGKLDRRLVSELPLPLDEIQLADNEEEQAVLLTHTEQRLLKIWKEILGLKRRITRQADFFHVGGSSTLLLSLRACIRESFDYDMPLVRMFEISTLGAMAHQIDQSLSFDAEDDPIDWNQETALMPELLEPDIGMTNATDCTLPEDNMNTRVVVLTGATGQLGRGLVNALLEDPLIGHIHCIGVRNATNRSNMAVFDNDRITLHEGELALPDLGLSKNRAAAIFSKADAIIHNGADLSYLRTYRSLRAVNLQSTKDLIKMVARNSKGRKVPIHYVSTVSVGNIVPMALANDTNINDNMTEIDPRSTTQDVQDREGSDFVFGPSSVAAYSPPSVVSTSQIANLAHGYIATKWASEVVLENLQKLYPAWPVIIHRPSLIIQQAHAMPPNKGQNVGPRLEFLENLQRYSSLLRAVPTVPAVAEGRMNISGAFDVVVLSDVVKGMVDSLRSSLMESQEGKLDKRVEFIHHISGVELPLDDIRNLVLNNEHTEDIGEMDVMEWVQKAGELGMHPTVAALFQSMADTEGRLVFPRLAK